MKLLKNFLNNLTIQQFNNVKPRRGFTLIELLIVISIIGVLATIGLTALTGAQRSARDAKRIGVVREIITALESYYNANGKYPQTSGFVNSGPGCWIPDDFCPTYMNPVPSDPTNSGTLVISYSSAGLSRYQIDYTLERPNANAIQTPTDGYPDPDYGGNNYTRYAYRGGVWPDN